MPLDASPPISAALRLTTARSASALRASRPSAVACVAALRDLIGPGLALQAIAAVFVATYALVPAARPAYAVIAEAKRNSGCIGSALLLLGAGAVAPTLAAAWRGRWAPRRLCLTMLVQAIAWLALGALTDAMYALQDGWFADWPAATAIAAKVAVDQFAWTPLVPVPILLAVDALVNADFAPRAAISAAAARAALSRLPTLLLANWMVWVPTTALIYALPWPLQVPLCALAVCFWSLLLGRLRDRRTGGAP